MLNLLLGILSIVLAIVGQELLEAERVTWSVATYCTALALAVYAFRQQEFPGARLATEYGSSTGQKQSLRWLWISLPLLLVALFCSGWGLLLFRADFERPAEAWWFYIVGALLFLLATFLMQLLRGPDPDRRTHKLTVAPKHYYPIQWTLLALIGAGGIFMRLYRFDSLPLGTWYDEAVAVQLAQRILVDPSWRPLFPGAINVTGHYIYLVSRALILFENPTLAVRTVSVLFGIFSVPAAYFAGRELFWLYRPKLVRDKQEDERESIWADPQWLAGILGLMVAAFVAFSRWNVNFSRIGMYNIVTPFLALLSIALLLRAARRNNYFEYGLAGLAIGLGLCFYTAFLFFVAALGLYLLYRILFERGFLRTQWVGLTLMTVLIILISAPLATFAYDKSDVYFSRTKETSLLVNTPVDEQIPALIENTRKHLLMFNYIGDPNGRHNLPGKPMLDSITGALLLLGLALCLRWLGRPTAVLLLGWFFFSLLGGILTLNFEAPQSLRSIAAQPVVYLLAALPLYMLGQVCLLQWPRHRVMGWLSPQWIFGVLLLLCALPMAYENHDIYFSEQATDFASWNAFSTPETFAADLFNQIYDEHLPTANENDPVDVYVISYFIDHPSFTLIANESNRAKRLETTTQFPLSVPADRHVYFLMNADSLPLYNQLKSFYPDGDYAEIAPPFGGPVIVYQAHLTPDDLAGIQGLSAAYFPSADWRGEPINVQESMLRFAWPNDAPLSSPFSVEWDGILNVADYGQHHFFIQAPDFVEIYLDQHLVWSQAGNGSFALTLAKGNHQIRIRAVGSSGPFSLSWQTPNHGIELIPPQSFYQQSVGANGLLGRYYPNGEWTEPLSFMQIEPTLNLYFHNLPLLRPYTVEWSGQIYLPEDGMYTFGLKSIDEAILHIGGKEILAPKTRDIYAETRVNFAAGFYPITMQYADRTDHSHIYFYWQPPNGRHEIVPPDVLFPNIATYETAPVPNAELMLFNDREPAAPTRVIPRLGGSYRFFESNWAQLSGIVIAPDGPIYVTDAPNQRVLALSSDGTFLYELSESASGIALVEPTDLAIDSQNQLYVLDAVKARIVIFDKAGVYVRTLLTDLDSLDRSRGLHVDYLDRVWVANTPRGRVIALDQAGERLLEILLRPGADSQPVDVAVGSDGKIFVTDASLHKLVRFSADGRREQAWDLAPSVTLFGPHLAIDQDGVVYLSDPSSSKIAKLAADGQRSGEWELRGPDGQITTPVGLTVDADGAVWYVDNTSQTIGLIEPLP